MQNNIVLSFLHVVSSMVWGIRWKYFSPSGSHAVPRRNRRLVHSCRRGLIYLDKTRVQPRKLFLSFEKESYSIAFLTEETIHWQTICFRQFLNSEPTAGAVTTHQDLYKAHFNLLFLLALSRCCLFLIIFH
jgi:hypothetical protein